jgi:hypothetical protein
MKESAKWATGINRELMATLALSHASRARFSNFLYPGVPLRYTPGFMLPPAARVLGGRSLISLSRVCLSKPRQLPASFFHTLASPLFLTREETAR